jgi:LuxR family transcriptional regulator, maltose regulon positive regulatory protein
MAQAQIVKITRPDVHNSVNRSRVFEILNRACDKPAVWISAPAGSGKTTLVAGFLEERGRPCLWYQMDEGDADLAAFFCYLGRAVGSGCRDLSTRLPLLTPEYAHSEAIFAKRFFEQVFAQLSNDDAPPACLVLDDYQQIPEDAELHEVLARAVEAVPGGMNFIIISRHQPPPQYAKLRANNRLAMVGGEDIRFSCLETRELIGRALGQSLNSKERQRVQAGVARAGLSWPDDLDAVAARFHQAADGWAAGLVLLAENIKSGELDLDFFNLPHPPEEIIAYFSEEVCGDIDANTIDFLTRTAILPKMTPQIAEAVSGNHQAGRILAVLNRRNCFTEKRALPFLVYQYHPLFRNFLLARARKHLPSEELQQLLLRAARLLAASDETDDALELLFAARGFDTAVRLVLLKAPAMIAEGRNKTLETWLRRLPETCYKDTPWLSYWRGVCRCFFAPDRALAYFQCAFHGFETQEDQEGALLAWSGAVDAILLERGDFLQLDPWVEWLDERLSQGLSFPSREIEIRITGGMVGAILARHAAHPQARKWLDRADELVADHPESMHLLYLIIYYLTIGNTRRSGLLVKKLEPYVTGSASPLFSIKWCLVKAMHAHMVEGAGRKAIRWAEKGLAIARETGIHVFDQYLLAQGVHGGLAVCDPRATKKFLNLMAATMQGRSLWDVSNYHFLHGWREYCEGNIHGFGEHLQLALSLATKIGSNPCRAIGQAGLALYFVEIGDPGEAERRISLAETIMPGNGGAIEFIYLLVKARISFHRNDEETGFEFLGRALELGRGQSYFTAPFWRHETMSWLCARAIERNLEPEYVREVVRRRNLRISFPGRPELVWIENWSYQVRIFTLGRFEIEINGRTLKSPGRIQKKPLDLLKVLAAYGGMDIPIQKVTDAIYPDMDGDRAVYSFKHTLHRLRKLLDGGDFLLRRGGKLFFDRRFCFIDSEAFLRLSTEVSDLYRMAHPLPPGGDSPRIERILQTCQKAIDLYVGDFLADDENLDCIAVAREKLRKKFLEVVDIAAGCLEAGRRHREAVELYERAIEADPLQEYFYRRLMLCYQQTGRLAAALAAYEDCRKALAAGMGIEPSLETRTVYGSLLE